MCHCINIIYYNDEAQTLHLSDNITTTVNRWTHYAKRCDFRYTDDSLKIPDGRKINAKNVVSSNVHVLSERSNALNCLAYN